MNKDIAAGNWDRNNQGTDRKQRAQKKPQRDPQQDPRRPGVDQPDLQRDHGDRAHPSSRPEQPDKGREGGMDRRPVEPEGDERSDRGAGAGRPVQLDDEDDLDDEDEETPARA